MFHKSLKRLSAFFIGSQLLFIIGNSLFSDTILVTNTDSGIEDGSLGAAIYMAQDGDIIDCSMIAGETISINLQFPAVGGNFTSPTESLSILGSGVIIDGGNSLSAFPIMQGSAVITNLTIQNCLSQGGPGGSGYTGGGGGTGGGGAIYIHTGATMTISAISLNSNEAIGGAGGSGNATGGSGGGGGGYGGGNGGSATLTAAGPGSGGGGGGNKGRVNGGGAGRVGSPNSFNNYGGAGGGGATPATSGGNARSGGTAAAGYSTPAKSGGAFGASTAANAGGGGGGAGSGERGSNGDPAESSPPKGGRGGAGGVLGGGGGASRGNTGGAGGFGAGGGAGSPGGADPYGLGGSGGTGGAAGGGGGSGLGGAIFIQKGGLLIVEDGISFSSNQVRAGAGGIGTGASGGGGSSLGQDIFIRAGGSLTFQVGGTLSISNPIQGGGWLSDVTGPGVLVSGTGTVNLNGANTYLGGTLIQSGMLNLNGSALGDLQIESGGALSGNATVNGSIYSSGVLSPGNSIGEVFTTDLYLYPTSVYDVEVNSSGSSDEIIASGLAQVGGGIVVTPDDFNFTTPLTYTIISTSTGIMGEFSSLTSSTPSLMSLIYNPLTIQLTYLPLGAVSLMGNAFNAASGFSTLQPIPGSDVATVNNALLALGFNDMQPAFEQMGPAQFSALTEVQLQDAILVRSTYTKHLQEFCFKKDPCCKKSISFWIDSIGQWQNQKKSAHQFGYRDTTFGSTIGATYCFHDLLLGLAFSYTHDDFHLKNFASRGHINSYYGGWYGYWNHDGFYMNAAFLGAHNKYKTTRGLNFGTIDRQAHSKHNGNEWLANFGFGYQVCPSSFRWTPYINCDYVNEHERSYTETGADSLNLHVRAKNAELFQGEAGVLFSVNHCACNGAFVPMLTLAYVNQTPLSSKNYHANFASSTSVFTGAGGNYKRNLFAPRLAVSYQGLCNRVNASIYYDSEIGSRYWAQDVGFDLTFRF